MSQCTVQELIGRLCGVPIRTLSAAAGVMLLPLPDHPIGGA